MTSGIRLSRFCSCRYDPKRQMARATLSALTAYTERHAHSQGEYTQSIGHCRATPRLMVVTVEKFQRMQPAGDVFGRGQVVVVCHASDELRQITPVTR